ncbi:MAG: choice-of-anchor Q domain-containing protein [Acidobacteriota bacterium]
MWNRSIVCLALLSALTCLSPARLDAAIFLVTTVAADGEGSFKRALEDANAAPGPDLVLFASELTGVVDLSGVSLPAVTESVEIVGPGAGRLAVDGGLARRVLSFGGPAESTYSMLDLTVQRGRVGSVGDRSGQSRGGGIRLESGTLVLENVALRDSVALGAGEGGGVYVDGGAFLRLVRCVVTRNQASSGGGIYAAGDVTVEKSTLSANVAEAEGAGLFGAGTVRLFESTLSGNRAVGSGLPTGRGGGVFIDKPGLLIASHATLVDNRALSGPGISSRGTVGSVSASIIARNLETDTGLERNCESSLGPADANNLSGDMSCGFSGASDLEGVDPELWPLLRLGGSTPTHVPRPGSPVIDAAGTAFCIELDQRDAPRPSDGDGSGVAECDIGAVEFTAETDGGLVFVDGFESGDVSSWSGQFP